MSFELPRSGPAMSPHPKSEKDSKEDLTGHQLGHNPYLMQARHIIISRLKPYRFQLYLFGSQARGQSSFTSDIDIGVLPISPFPPGLLSEIREELEESSIPYPVELVDLTKVGSDFVTRVEKEGVLWND